MKLIKFLLQRKLKQILKKKYNLKSKNDLILLEKKELSSK